MSNNGFPLASLTKTIIVMICIILQLSIVADTLSTNTNTTTNEKTNEVLGANVTTRTAQTPLPKQQQRYLFPKKLDDLQKSVNDSLILPSIIPRPSCQDVRPNCGNFKALCNNTTFESIMKEDCPQTCGLCEQSSKRVNLVDKEFLLLPNIESNDNNLLKAVSASSLSKTIIKGTCFDEYIYCAEFAAMCHHGEYEELMARHCSLTCNRCEVQHKERETCEDYVECEGMKALCFHEIYNDIMKKQCRKTCNVCTPESEGCKDRHKNCSGFKDDGFCDNPVYTIEERTYLCGSSCKLC